MKAAGQIGQYAGQYESMCNLSEEHDDGHWT